MAEPLGLPPAQLRHYRERIDVPNGANAFVADQAKNAETRLNELYAGKCHRGVFFERVHALDADAADQPCIFMPDNPNGLAQVCVGYTAQVRHYAAGDIITGIHVQGTDQGFVLASRPGYVYAAIQGTTAGVLRVGQSVALRLTHAYYSHGAQAGVAGELLSARDPAPAFVVGAPDAPSALSAADVAALAPAVERAQTAAAWIAAHRKEPAVAKFVAMYGAAKSGSEKSGAAKSGASGAVSLAKIATTVGAVPAGVWTSGGVAGVMLPAREPGAAGPRADPVLLPAARAVGELVIEWARMCETVRALSVEFADDDAFAAHSNVWRATAAE